MMKMKKLMMIAVMMVATLTASAQQEVGTWSITPTLKFNLANIVGDNTDGFSMKLGLAAGADAMYQLSPLVGLSGGLFYSMQGCEGSGDLKYNIDELLIPLMAHFYVYPNLALMCGLQPGFIVSAKSKTDKVEVDVKDDLQSIELSLPLGISYEFSNFVVGARYNLGITKVNKGNGSQRNSVIQFSVGYKIPLGRK